MRYGEWVMRYQDDGLGDRPETEMFDLYLKLTKFERDEIFRMAKMDNEPVEKWIVNQILCANQKIALRPKPSL